MRKTLLKLINAYQLAIRPILGLKLFLLFDSICKYYPTCSEYTHEAIDKYGARKGSWLAVTRVLRCNPFSSGGVDLP